MTGTSIDLQLLSRFEAGLDPRRPEHGAIPARVLDYGETSTILTIGGKGSPALVYKRLPVFLGAEDAGRYETLHRRYVKTLGERAGVRVASTTTVQLPDLSRRYVVVYIVQELLPEDTICHMAIYRLSPSDVYRLVMAILGETAKVFDLNQVHQGELELGIDSETSNWALLGFDPDKGELPDRLKLVYLHTNVPFMRRHGVEQFDPDPFLRSAPSMLLPIIRRAFLPELLTRFYDFRRVAIDLVAKIHQEGRSELVPGIIDAINWYFLAERREYHFRPVTLEEVLRFHRRDAFVWRAYLFLRRVDRRVCLLRRRPYPYILPSRRR
jgi:hypothetical protein